MTDFLPDDDLSPEALAERRKAMAARPPYSGRCGVGGAGEKLPHLDLRRAVNDERDRRQAAGFTVDGVRYQTGARHMLAVQSLYTQASVAISVGKLPGDLKWRDGERDFAFITADNSRRPMDAQTCFATCALLIDYVSDLVDCARTLKDRNPIPEDYANDRHWPPAQA